MLRCTGEVVRIEHKRWDIDGRSGVTVRCRIAVSRSDWADVKIPDGVQIPSDGQMVDLAVNVLAKQRGGFDLVVVGPWDQFVGKPLATAAKSA